MSTLIPQPVNRSGLTNTPCFREQFEFEQMLRNCGPSFWFQFFLSVTVHAKNTFSFPLARRASSKECLSGFCYPCILSHLYQPYDHVITGDLSVIPDSKLRDLIAKDPKYREPCKVYWDKNLSLLCEVVDQYALQWAKHEIVELSVLSSWKEMVKGQIDVLMFMC